MTTSEKFLNNSFEDKIIILPHGKIIRTVEGVNVLCNNKAKSIILDNSSCDDFPVNAKINFECVNEFKKFALKNDFPEYDFLHRSGIYSGKFLTSAGALMFGDLLNITAVLNHENLHAELHASNIWKTYTEILPRLTLKLSDKCAVVVRELLINALLHSDYNIDNHISVTIFSSPAQILINNPGILFQKQNHRLKKIFKLSGISPCKNSGIKTIKKYFPDFQTFQYGNNQYLL